MLKNPKIHILKCWPGYFKAIIDGYKNFEIRKNDRNFEVGDILQLREYNPNADEYSGKQTFCTVTYIFQSIDLGLNEGYCAMSIRPTFITEFMSATFGVSE